MIKKNQEKNKKKGHAMTGFWYTLKNLEPNIKYENWMQYIYI